jgi:HTH-type transcriptional regulator, competence development regulator
MKETFGEYVRKLRTEKELTLTQLAAQLGIDSANLSKIETGKREFDEKKLNKLSKIFKLDIDRVKEEFYSEKIARKIYEVNCSENTLVLAEQKVKYLKQKNQKQATLNLE